MTHAKKPAKPCSCGSCAPVRSDPSCGCQTESHPLKILPASGTITFAENLDHFLARWGVNRMGHLVVPGLYRLGAPTSDSPVIVTANYTLSFDAVRASLAGIDCLILVLDTRGVNVWCAAGKGTFGTEELVRRIEVTGLASAVRHRALVLPQLGAPGIAAHEVQKRSGFRVEYGPVRARDLPKYLQTHSATPEMRRVEFPIVDRVILTPVEVVHVAVPTIVAMIALYLLAGPAGSLAALAAVLGGTVIFPALFPFLPTKDFSTKGMLLGLVIAIPFALDFAKNRALPQWAIILSALLPLLLIPAVTGYLALNFTGCSTFTSRTGVKKEIFHYVPSMVFMAIAGIIIAAVLGVTRLMGVI